MSDFEGSDAGDFVETEVFDELDADFEFEIDQAVRTEVVVVDDVSIK